MIQVKDDNDNNNGSGSTQIGIKVANQSFEEQMENGEEEGMMMTRRRGRQDFRENLVLRLKWDQ